MKSFRIWILILLAISITFSPDFLVMTIVGGRQVMIRAEDVLLAVLGIAWVCNFLLSGQKKIAAPPLFPIIAAWLIFGLVSTLINIILGNINIVRAFFYYLKEFEFFFIYFLTYHYLSKIKNIPKVMNYWTLICFLAIGLIIYQIFNGVNYGAYGASLLNELGPLPSGGFFLVAFVFLINYFLFYCLTLQKSKIYKIILGFGVISISMGVVASLSKAAVIGLAISLILTFIFYTLKSKSLLKPLSISLLVLIACGMFFILPLTHNQTSRRLTGIFHPIENVEPRVRVWLEQLASFPINGVSIVFGLGKSAIDESHNQFTRNLIDTGVAGSLIFLLLLTVILKKTGQAVLKSRQPLKIALASGAFITTLTLAIIGLTAESFLVVRIMTIYWYFMAIAMYELQTKQP